MKTVLNILMLCLILFSACKKDPKVCTTYTELNDHNNLVDITPLSKVPEFKDTLNKYIKQLQVTNIDIEKYGAIMNCNVFYKELKVFTDDYQILKNYNNFGMNDTVYCNSGSNFILDTVNFSLTPTIQIENAISIAKGVQKYTNTCISYRLGIYNINASDKTKTRDYKLVWLVQGESGYPYVYLDANMGKIYASFDGIIIN